jgi:hypothetical protein
MADDLELEFDALMQEHVETTQYDQTPKHWENEPLTDEDPDE